MAKYNVTHKCGHVAQHDIKGGQPQLREWKLNELSQAICWECQKEAATAAATEQAVAAELPTLVGTEKQVNWAMIIRSKALASIEGVIIGWAMRLDGQPQAQRDHFKTITDSVKAALLAPTNAQDWINVRFEDFAAKTDETIRERLLALRAASKTK